MLIMTSKSPGLTYLLTKSNYRMMRAKQSKRVPKTERRAKDVVEAVLILFILFDLIIFCT